jgi:DNA-binding MarR family transcriptional regulator
MTADEALKRPIGWWLKEADARLNAAFDRALEGTGIDRRGWQVLISLLAGPKPRAELVASLAPFDDPATVERVLDDLAARGLVEAADDALRLAAEGAATQRALAPKVGAVRGLVHQALSDEDYVELVRLLSRLVDGLDPANPAN